MKAESFDLPRLLRDVFAPTPNERVAVLTDTPPHPDADHAGWRERRVMAAEWRDAFEAMGVRALPPVFYPATGANNADLPPQGEMGGQVVSLETIVADIDLAVAMTEYSATAPLMALTRRHPRLRAASMPGVLRRMERTALAVDAPRMAKRAVALAEQLQRAEQAEVLFSTGHRCRFDLRFRDAHADDGLCRPDRQGLRVINLPGGEAFIAPYEGERPDVPSRTEGELPVWRNGEVIVLHVEHNRIAALDGHGEAAAALRDFFDQDPARRNVAEFGMGCNDRAVVSGSVLEDEKAGFHWAYGRSEHLGGTVSPAAFSSPSHVVHHDIVYARGCPIEATSILLTYPDGSSGPLD